MILVFVFGLGLMLCIACLILIWFEIGMMFVCTCIWGADPGLLSQVLLLRLYSSVSVKNRIQLLACSVWAMRCIALLWRAILGPLCVGFHMLIGGVAMCFCHCFGTMCNWDFGMWGAKIYFFYGFPCIGHIWILVFEYFGHLLHSQLSISG